MKNNIHYSGLDRRRKAAALRAAVVGCLALLVSLMLLARWGSAIVSAADGDLDPTFGSGGKVVPGPFSGFDAIYDVAEQTDGKLQGFSKFPKRR